MDDFDHDFYVLLHSCNCVKVFPQNNGSEFTVRLPQTVDLKGDWEVAVTDFQYENDFRVEYSSSYEALAIPRPTMILIYCNAVCNQFVGGEKKQLLGVVPIAEYGCRRGSVTFNQLNYVRVAESSLRDIKISLTDQQGKPLVYSGYKDFTLVRLHFCKRTW